MRGATNERGAVSTPPPFPLPPPDRSPPGDCRTVEMILDLNINATWNYSLPAHHLQIRRRKDGSLDVAPARPCLALPPPPFPPSAPRPVGHAGGQRRGGRSLDCCALVARGCLLTRRAHQPTQPHLPTYLSEHLDSDMVAVASYAFVGIFSCLSICGCFILSTRSSSQGSDCCLFRS